MTHCREILSVEEMARIIDAAASLLHRAMLMVLYSTGMRNPELRQLVVIAGQCGDEGRVELFCRGLIEALWRNAAQPSERFPVGCLSQKQYADGVVLAVGTAPSKPGLPVLAIVRESCCRARHSQPFFEHRSPLPRSA